MKRTNTLGVLSLLALITLIGLVLFTPNASANRSFGFEQGEIASVDVFALIDRALSKDEKTSERQAYESSSNAVITNMQQQLIGIQAKLQSMQPDDPNINAEYQEYQQMQSNLQAASQNASTQYQTLIAEQIAEAYSEIYAAVNEIASEQGFAYVFASRSDGDLLQTDSINGITQEILARPLVTPPAATDLTEVVRVRLDYPAEVLVEDLEPVDVDAQAEPESGEPEPADPMGEE